LLPFQVNDLSKVIPDVLKNSRKTKDVTMAKAILNDGQVLYAVNDLFIGQKTHVSSRYTIEIDQKKEQHSSSGVIVSTGLGSTAWMKSIITGAFGIVSKFTDTDLDFGINKPIAWNAQYLIYSVREPFVTKVTKAELVFGKVKQNTPLTISSLMPENGVIFSDGIESDFLNFNSGFTATISVAEKQGHLVI